MQLATMSKHARVRQQQRAIPPLILEWLTNYGAVSRGPGGVEIRHFDRKARRRVAAAAGHRVVDLLGELLDTYMVVSDDGTVVTCGHRYKAIRTH